MAKRYSQPQTGPYAIDWANPVTEGLVYASTLDGRSYDAVNKRVGVNTAIAQVGNPRNGVASNFVSGSSSQIILPTTDMVSGYPLTVSCWADLDDSGGGEVLYSLNGTNYHAIAGAYGAGIIFSQDSAPGYIGASGLSGLHHTVTVFRSGTFSFYVDGVLWPQTGLGNFWGQPAAGNHSIGSRLGGASLRYNNGRVSDFSVWGRGLSPEEAKSVYENTNQIYLVNSSSRLISLSDGTIYGSLAATESGSDTAAFTGVAFVVGSLATSESGSDTAAFTGTNLAQGALAATESGADTAAFTGSSGTIAILAAVETGSDTASFSGVAFVSGSLATSESGSDTATLNGSTFVVGNLAASESGADTAAFNGGSSTIGILAAVEAGSDTASFGGLVLAQGTIAASESGSDTAAFTGVVRVAGSLAATETGSDTAAFAGGNPFVYIPSLRLMVSPERLNTLITSPSRTVPTFNSITRSVTFISPSRAILLSSSPSRTVAWSSPERSEVD